MQTESEFQCTPQYHADISSKFDPPEPDPHRIRNSGGPANWLGSLLVACCSVINLYRDTVQSLLYDRTGRPRSLDCRAFIRPTGVMILHPRINDSRRRMKVRRRRTATHVHRAASPPPLLPFPPRRQGLRLDPSHVRCTSTADRKVLSGRDSLPLTCCLPPPCFPPRRQGLRLDPSHVPQLQTE
jgi:hypothetical protein